MFGQRILPSVESIDTLVCKVKSSSRIRDGVRAIVEKVSPTTCSLLHLPRIPSTRRSVFFHLAGGCTRADIYYLKRVQNVTFWGLTAVDDLDDPYR